jgi:eukaryotic-like serine/threonine-protein kinase
MALATGRQLGPYEIEAAIGAGGMGEVYRARDIRLGRTVAIKVLPEGEYATDEARRRFQREARVVSGLSHPHICTIYDIGDEQGLQFIVMEYLEGETLAARLERGALPTPQVLQYGIEVADALEKAHRARIVHRDLKPGNIMLTKSGIKLLDFGLARITHRDSAPLMSALTALPTEDSNITGIGAILGTLQYMAPEQLEGHETDACTDIFAFGAVLYEMATGQRAFRGKSQSSLIAAILSSDPVPLLQLSPMSPPALDRVVQTCLEKDPEERWQTAHDVRLQLEWIRDASSQAGVPRVTAQRRVTRERAAWATATLLFLALVTTAAMRYVQPAAPAAHKLIFTLEPPPGLKFAPDALTALSPDGLQIAFAADDGKGKRSLWVRSLDSLSSKRLEGSESGADYYGFVWTSDGKALLAPVNGKLMRLSVVGGANEVLCDKFDGAPSSVNSNGVVLAWVPPPTKVFSVSAEDCTPHLRSPTPTPDTSYAYPHFLPDGNHFLLAALHKDKHHDVLLSSISDAATRVLMRNASYPKYVASGYILFSRDGYLMAQRFDTKTLRASGEAFLVHPNQLSFYAAFGWAGFDASKSGLISAKEQWFPPEVLRWYSRSGQVLKTIGNPEYRNAPRLAPLGNYAAVSLSSPRTHRGDIWSLDLEHDVMKRESFQDLPGSGQAAWSGNGRRLLYSAIVGTHAEMFVKEVGSEGSGQVIQSGLDGTKRAADISSDGNSILYLHEGENPNYVSIYGQSLAGGKSFLIAHAGVEEESPRLSPDGHWVAFQSTESGSSEIFVTPFAPGPGTTTQVSFGGGHYPCWSRDGKELFYRTNDWNLVTVPVLDLKQPRFGKPVTLFRLSENAEYDTVDGKRFLVNGPVGPATSPLFVIVNWKQEPPKSY